MKKQGGTSSGIGDKGQRYEIRTTGWPKAEKTVMGWCNTRAAAERWARGMLKAPGCTAAEFLDRQENVVVEVAGA